MRRLPLHQRYSMSIVVADKLLLLNPEWPSPKLSKTFSVMPCTSSV